MKLNFRNRKTPHKTIDEMNNGLSPTWPMDSFLHCVINTPIHFDFFLISAFRVQFFHCKNAHHFSFLFSLPVLCRFSPTITQQPQKSTLISLMVNSPLRLINQIHFLLYYAGLHNIYISKWGGNKIWEFLDLCFQPHFLNSMSPSPMKRFLIYTILSYDHRKNLLSGSAGRQKHPFHVKNMY
jgi:hypothetical protein